MKNPYQIELAKIINIKEEAEGVKLFRLRFLRKKSNQNFVFSPGQFVEVSIPGFGEAPFAICSDCFEDDFFEICVKRVGKLTAKFHTLRIGDAVGFRGPFGEGWPIANLGKENKEIKNKNYLLVAGGLGIAPLRPIILTKEKLLGKISNIQLFYGTRSPRDFLFQDEYNQWGKIVEINLTVDREYSGWQGNIGPVTLLFDKIKIPENSRAFLCGPPIMYKFVLEKLKEHNFKDEDIFLSLERRMHCGLGVCQHCAIGSSYVCKDGPVFSLAELKNIPDAI